MIEHNQALFIIGSPFPHQLMLISMMPTNHWAPHEEKGRRQPWRSSGLTKPSNQTTQPDNSWVSKTWGQHPPFFFWIPMVAGDVPLAPWFSFSLIPNQGRYLYPSPGYVCSGRHCVRVLLRFFAGKWPNCCSQYFR